MSTTPQTVVVQPGGHLKLQGQGKGPTTVEVQPTTVVPTTPPATHPIETHGAPWWAVLLGPVIAVAGAIWAQKVAHGHARERDDVKAAADAADRVLAAGYALSVAMNDYSDGVDLAARFLDNGASLEKTLQALPNQPSAAVVGLHGALRAYKRRCGADAFYTKAHEALDIYNEHLDVDHDTFEGTSQHAVEVGRDIRIKLDAAADLR